MRLLFVKGTVQMDAESAEQQEMLLILLDLFRSSREYIKLPFRKKLLSAERAAPPPRHLMICIAVAAILTRPPIPLFPRLISTAETNSREICANIKHEEEE